jgi:hypothetical protein
LALHKAWQPPPRHTRLAPHWESEPQVAMPADPHVEPLSFRQRPLVQIEPGAQSEVAAQAARHVPLLQVPVAQSLLALQCCAGTVLSTPGGTLAACDCGVGGLDDMLFGEQKLPAALMVQLSVEPQSASEWQPGQHPMVVQMVPAPHWALVVQGG